MNLRKNVPVQNENPPPPVKGAKKAFFKLIGGLAAVIALLFSMQSNYHYKPNTPNAPSTPKPVAVSQKLAEVTGQSNSNLLQNASDFLNRGSNKLKKDVSAVIAQRSKPRPAPVSASKPPQSVPKPVAQPQRGPTPSPANVARSSGRTTQLLSKVVNIGKVGLFLITKGKVRIR